MDIYCAHPVTREYIGQTSADPDPLEADNWLIPAHAYADKPPVAGAGETVIRGKDGWAVVPDHRGTVYRTANGEAVLHEQLGELPGGLTATAPPGPEYAWTGAAWEVDPELELKWQNRIMDDLCTAIDAAADAARVAAAGDPLRAMEYQRAADEARAYQYAGFPPDDVPRTVAAWAIQGRTSEQAALSIIAEAKQFDDALYYIREVRLASKEQVRALVEGGQMIEAQALAEQTIAAIRNAVAGVGNASST